MSAAPAMNNRAGDLRLRFSFGRNVKPAPGTPHDHRPADVTCDAFAARLAEPKIGPKGSGGFYLPTVFATGKRTREDSIAPACLVSIDLDFGDWSLDSIRAVIPAGIAWLAYSTASHSPEAPRYRVVIPLGEFLEVDRWILVSRGFMRLFGFEEGSTGFDTCTEKIAQPMYLPTIATPDAPFEFAADMDLPPVSSEMISDLIDDEETRAKAAEEEARIEREHRNEERRRKAERFGNRSEHSNVIERFNAEHPVEQMLESCGYTPPRAPGGRWCSPNSTAGKPAVRVWPEEGRFFSHHGCDQGTKLEYGDSFDLFRHFEHGGDMTAATRAAAEELGLDYRSKREIDASPPPAEPSSGEPPESRRKLPTILVNGREARNVVSDILFAIANANRPPVIFSRIGRVVRVVRNDFGVGEAREITAADQLNVVSAAADFTRFDARAKDEVTTHPRRELCAAAFARLESGPELPRLRVVTPTPIIHEDGKIVEAEGFDTRSGAYFAPTEGFRLDRVPEKPSPDQAQAAVSALMAPFRDLPFATDTDCANYLAALVTVVIRHWFPTVPFFVFEAPIQGSGKTLAAMATRVIGEGTAGIGAAPEAAKGGDAEWRKRITSILRTAPAVVIFDNVTGTLGGPTLAALATSPTYSDRILGTNEAPDLPNTPTWIFTSNNAQVDADLLRRCVFVRLDPRDPAPHLRSRFEIPDLIGHLEAHRGEILAAIYTLVRFWILDGTPPPPAGTPTLGSFEKWSSVVPAILGAVGVTGVLADIDERNAMMRDPDEEDAAEFLQAWWEGFPNLRADASAKDLIAAALAGDTPGREVLPLPAAVVNGKGSDAKPAVLARSLGKWMKFRRDRIVASEPGVTFVIRLAGGSEKRGFRWGVERHEITRESE